MTERWEKLSGLFHAAIERAPAERDAFLDSACEGDAELRAEVDSLLKAHAQSADFLAQPAADLASALIDDEAGPLAAGERIGSYLIREQIGRGGMGVVYLAEDTRLGRDVALKVLPPGFASDEQRRERLRLEARAAATLSHPGIATVHALEEIGPTLFLVFEYVSGRTLREEIRNRPMEVPALIAAAWRSRGRWRRLMPKASFTATSSPTTSSWPSRGTSRCSISASPGSTREPETQGRG